MTRREAKVQPGEIPADIYRRFVESIEDYAMIFLDKTGAISSWNAGARRIKGYEAAEVIGRNFSICYTPRDVADKRHHYALRVAAMEGVSADEGWRVRKDGSTFWANVTITALRDEGGDLLGFAEVTRDLTERRQQEEAVRHGEERFRLLVESVKDYAIFVLDPMGRVVTWNEGAERMKGYRAEEILGHHFSTFYTQPDRDRQHPKEELRIATKEGRYEEEGWRVRKDGTRFWANVTITALRDAHGVLRGFAKVTRDLTSRKIAEDELRRRAAEHAGLNRELDAFTSAVAHDLRAPLRAMLNLSEIVIEEENGRLSPASLENLEAIRKSGERMGVLLESLLELSRATKGDLDLREVDLSLLAVETWDEIRRRDPRIKATLHVQPGLQARGDPRLVQILLDNLLRNAAKFSARSDEPRIEVGCRALGDEAAFFVRDNGLGFDPEHAASLFQPFHRLPSAAGFEGTGVGLATVRRIVTRHGGRVWAEGEPEKGATFWFTLAPSVKHPGPIEGAGLDP